MKVLMCDGNVKEMIEVRVIGIVGYIHDYDIWYGDINGEKYCSHLVKQTKEIVEIERKIKVSIEDFSKTHEYGDRFEIKLYFPMEEGYNENK